MVAVVIPLYKVSPTKYDLISLDQCFKTLSEFPIIAVKPHGLSLDSYNYSFSKVISLEDENFKNIAAYNRLMMSASFYSLFSEYDYILIHQTDAFVFKNELTKWCLKGYDYIGAPWLLKKASLLRSAKRFVYNKLGIPKRYHLENKVGNGGFSLRKVALFREYCETFSNEIELYLSKIGSIFNEDVFWSIEVNKKGGEMSIPHYDEAVFFSIENDPLYAMKLTKGGLSFGCHAWEKNIGFFGPIIRKYGYRI